MLLRSVKPTHKQTYADNQDISFLPVIMSTSNRMHGEFLRVLFLQTHRETEAHFTAAGMPSQRNQSELFRGRAARMGTSKPSVVDTKVSQSAGSKASLADVGLIVPSHERGFQ